MQANLTNINTDLILHNDYFAQSRITWDRIAL